MYELIKNNIIGRFAMSKDDADLLRDAIIEAGAGDYIEIGTLWGASAVLAGLVHELHGIPGKVYAIDPMIGYYGSSDGEQTPGKHDFYMNMERFGVCAELIVSKSDPFPIEGKASVILIDGDHSPAWVKKDWKNAQEHSTRFVVFHDYNDPAIKRLVDGVDGWKVWKKIDTMAVLEKV